MIDRAGAHLGILIAAAVTAMAAASLSAMEPDLGGRTLGPTAAPTSLCSAHPTKSAAPVNAVLGEPVTVTTRVRVLCTGYRPSYHFVFVLDGSNSMTIEASRDMKAHAQSVVRGLQLDQRPSTRIGVVESGSITRSLCRPNSDERSVLNCIRRVGRRGDADLAAGIAEGTQMLRAAREGTWQRFLTEVLIVMSDGHVDDDCRAADAAGRQAGKSGILVIAACASRQCNERCLAEVAAGPRYFFRHNEHVLMLKAFERIFDRIIKINLRWLRILDDPAPHVIYDQGSGTPEPEDEDEGRLAWEWVYIPTDGVTITHRVIPVATGEIPTSREASGAMQDNFGRTVEFDFEIPIITVHEPTATVTASPTATPTTPPTTPPTPNVTPMLEPVYMPRAVRVE